MSEPFLSEDQARRLWERAAALQAESARKKEAEAKRDEEGSDRKLLQGTGDDGLGYSLANIRQAGLEAGIQGDFLDLALAEEAILELEGGAEPGPWDRTTKRFLSDDATFFEIRRTLSFPAQQVWMALEDALTSEAHGMDLLEVWGEGPAQGGMAIFEAPYTYEDSGSLKYWSTVAEVRRYMVQVQSEEEGRVTVVVRAPLRRTHRVHGALGLALTGVFSALGGGLGLGLTALIAASGGAGLPLAVAGAGLIGGGTLGSERLSRFAFIKTYRWGLRSLEKAFQRVLTRIERDLKRQASYLPPNHNQAP